MESDEEVKSLVLQMEKLKMKVPDLKQKAKEMGLSGYSKLKKDELLNLIAQQSVSKSKRLSKSTKKSPVKISPSRGQLVKVGSKSMLSPGPFAKMISSPKLSPPRVVKKPSVKRIRVIRKIGPNNDLNKYGLLKALGKGEYGTTYKVVNLNQQPGEDEFYALKIMHFNAVDPSLTQAMRDRVRKNWEREVKCLEEIYHLCHQIGILCHKESFIVGDEFVIVTSLLDGYMALGDFLFKRKSKNGRDYNLTKDILEKIYSDIIEVKNALTELCINHSDLHYYNIMIEPKSRNVKIIDFGRCQTPEEEEKEWAGDQNSWNTYSDVGRLKELLRFFYMALKGLKQVNPNDKNLLDFIKEMETKYPITPYVKGCQRK